MTEETEKVPAGQLLLVSGESGTGKSTSLMNLPNQERWAYCNTESGKALPFKNSFQTGIITDPYDMEDYFNAVADTENDNFDGIIIDSLTFLMDMLESQYVIPAKDGREAWGAFNQYFKNMMQQQVTMVTSAGKHVIFLAHTRTEQDAQLIDRINVPIKGALKNQGIEAYFSTVVSTMTMPLASLKEYKSKLLNISEDDKLVGFKHVFQTRKTKATVGSRIRGPIGLFDQQHTFIDNDVSQLLQHMVTYYS